MDYKIMETILAKLLNVWIHSDQTGFIMTRQMKDNTRKIINIIDQAQNNKIPAMLFFANAEKEFDTLE